jgi:glycine/D-amino acid oxidase-like deaminating enzyme
VGVRERLGADLDVDVCVVGGGFTGLWTARELLRREPALRVAVLEQSVCGFGASGRNGGWASALYPLSDAVVARRYGEAALGALRRTLQRAVTHLGEAAAADGVDAQFVQGGTLCFARSDLQAQRLRSAVAAAHASGLGEGDLAWLDAEAARARAAVSEVHGATYSPHCARVHPARLVRGLADAAELVGATIFEDTTVQRIEPARRRRRARVVTAGAVVRADVVVRATEGFTPTLPGLRRELAPIYSMMVATEPLSAGFWEATGLARHETFADDRHLIIYGQRTADDRIAFGGRGAPYHFGSAVEARFDGSPRVFGLLEETLHELFPHLDGAITHRWGGPLGMPRDLSPSVRVDAASGLASAGGYTGDGVVLAYVAAQALADLITAPGVATRYSTLPFVQRASRRWEIEPARWLGINVGLALAGRADALERRRGVTSRAEGALERLFDQFPP